MTESMILLHHHAIFSKTMSFKHQFILSVYLNSRLNCSLKFSLFLILLNRTGFATLTVCCDLVFALQSVTSNDVIL